ncbi:hypothetical protein G7Y89_g9542 [Cudoniella acicularis]|uniref:Rhodopsin domain-containing protein n=1 Tax=Cudoniella acicularis TaxID=354080 RepID=A0A8H4REG4_9HELO|nr:hypothetical protein G7Y89_g9542 [Cudoniella acicularis]
MASEGSAMTPVKVESMITTASIVVSIVFPVLSLIAILIRIRARRAGRLNLQADDWGMILTWILTLALSIVLWVLAGISGIDYFKVDELSGNQATAKLLLLTSSMAEFPLAAVKISILLFYKRVFSTKKFAIAVWALIPLITAWGLIFFFIILFNGKPVSAAWTGVGVLQFDTVDVGLAQGGSSIVLDIIVLCLPIPIILGLHMHAKRKVAVIGMFWLGAFCVVVAVLRLVFLKQATQQAIDSAKAGEGFSAVSLESKLFIFVLLEPNCSIIAGCLPCYGPLFTGGRGLDSIIRSIRSVLSLQSIRSALSGGGLNQEVGIGELPWAQRQHRRRLLIQGPNLRTSLGARVAIIPPWNTHKTEAHSNRGGPSSINVTKAVDVTTT